MTDFQAVRDMYDQGYTQKQIAEEHGISRGYVSNIVTGRAGFVHDEKAEAQIQGLRDSRNWTRRRLRDSLRVEDLYHEAAEIAARQIKPLKPAAPVKVSKRKTDVEETAVLVLSDGHHDQVVRPAEVGGLENHDFSTSLNRAEVLVDAVIKFTQATLSNYSFDRLVVLSLGDSTSGEIHDAEPRSAFGNQFKNCLAIGALHAAMFRDFAAHFPRVEVHCVSGNHGRRTTTKQYAGGAHNNWDWLCNKIAQSFCSSNTRISFDTPDSFDTIVDVRGWGFHCSHGDDVAGGQHGPAANLRKRHERQASLHRGASSGKSVRVGDAIDYAIIGHHHQRADLAGNGVEYLVNGAWLATDPYAYQKMGVAGIPSQYLFGVHRDHGITWRLPVNLLGRDKQKKSRYHYVKELVA